MLSDALTSPPGANRYCEDCGATLAPSRHHNTKLCMDCYDLGAKAREWRKAAKDVAKIAAVQIASLEQECERLRAELAELRTRLRDLAIRAHY